MAAALEPTEVLVRLAAAVPTMLPGLDAVLIPEGDPRLDDVELRGLLDRRLVVAAGGPAPRAVANRIPVGAVWSIHPLVAADRSVGLLVLHARGTAELSRTEIDLAEVLQSYLLLLFDAPH